MRTDTVSPETSPKRSPDVWRRAAAPFVRIRERLLDPKTRIGTVFCLVAVTGLLGLILYGFTVFTDLPSEQRIREARYSEATVLLTRHTGRGEEEITRYSDENRSWVPLDSIHANVINALLAAEDHRFFQHSGVDVRRLFSSVFKTIAGDRQGGSTLTMQFARNAFPELADDGALTRKFKEWILALSLERTHSKETILEMYLNTVPFLYNAFGIEAAAQTYFQKSARDLGKRESATLVGMLKGTAYYNPVRNPERSHARRNIVLEQMVRYGCLDRCDSFEPFTAEEYERWKDVPTELNFKPLSREDLFAPYFADVARQELDAWAEDKGINLYRAGLRVYTTLDPRLQEAAERAVEIETEKLQRIADRQWTASSYRDTTGALIVSDPMGRILRERPQLLTQFIRQTQEYGDLVRKGLSPQAALDSLSADEEFTASVRERMRYVQAAFIAMEPGTRAVRAYVGGRGFGDKQFDHAGAARRQPGSTFKPFVYAAALETGKFKPTSTLMDSYFQWRDPVSGDIWRPRNSGSVSGRSFTLREALTWSKNTVTARLITHRDVGPQRVVELAQAAGIESPLLAVPSLGLGTSEVTLLEMTTAYSTFADGGRYRKPMYIERIEGPDGEVIEEFGPKEARQAVSPRTSYDILDMLRSAVRRGTGTRIRSYLSTDLDLAGKTGTTQNGADGWFMLAHPNLVMGAWVGFDSPLVSWRSSTYQQGSRTALPIVGAFVQRASRLRGVLDPEAEFTQPGEPPRRREPQRVARPDTAQEDERLLPEAELELEELGDEFEAVPSDSSARRPSTSTADSLNRASRLQGNPQPIPREEPQRPPDTTQRRIGW